MKGKIKNILRTYIGWIVIWTILELIIPGPTNFSSFGIYIGAMIGYAFGVFSVEEKTKN